MTIEEVRIALADACATIPFWRGQPYLLDAVNPPEIHVGHPRIVYDAAMGQEADEYHYTLTAYAQRDSIDAAQKTLQRLCEPTGDGSLKYTLENDESVLALVDYIRVSDASKAISVTVGLIEYIVVEFEVEVG